MYRFLVFFLSLMNMGVASSQTTIYHWLSNGGVVNQTGGTITQCRATTVNRINVKSSGYYVIAILGRAENIDQDNTEKSQYMEITLSGGESFREGDIITFTGMRNCTTTTANATLFMQFENGTTIKDEHIWNNLGLLYEVTVEGGTGRNAPRKVVSDNVLSNVSTEPSTYSFIVPHEADGCKKLRLSRDVYECRLYLTEINVTRHRVSGMRITFKDDTPTANIAFATGAVMTHSGNNLVVKASTVGDLSYPIANIKKIEHLQPKESFHIVARSTPKTKGKYYSTFYSGEWSYALPEGVTAYTAHIDDNNIQSERIDGGIIPANVAVVLKSDRADYDLMMVDCATGVDENDLKGVDVATAQDMAFDYFVLSKGQNGDNKDVVGFYKLSPNVDLPANKAYFDVAVGSPMSCKPMLPFDDEEDDGSEDAIISVTVNDATNDIYNIGGQRLSELQRGVNIVNGRKVIKK